METINFKELMHYVWTKFYLVVLVFILVVTGGEVYTNLIQTPLYSSSAEVVILNENSNNLTNQDVLLSNNLVNTYAEIVKSRNVLDKTANSLDLGLSTDDLRSKLSVSTTTSTQLLTIKASDENPETAQKIAEKVSETFKEEIKNLYGTDNVQIVDHAALPSEPYNVNLIKSTIIYSALGLVLGFGLVFALFLLDTSIKDSKTVESRTGLNVIGVIPNVQKS